MSKWIAAGYFRLSREDGDNAESDSIKNQKGLLTHFTKKEKDIKIKDYYVDDGYSGTDFDRPDFQRMLNDIICGEINTVIVKDLSRLGRNYIEVGKYIEEVFPTYNIRFIAINDNVDSYKDPKSVNNVMVPFKNLMNDEYARDISNKVRSTLDTKKTNGEFIGSVAPYGYIKDPKNKHKFIIDREAARIIKKIFTMILNGKSKKEVVDELNNSGCLPPAVYQVEMGLYKHKLKDTMYYWDTKKLDSILQNRTYIGDLIQGGRKNFSHKIHRVIRTDAEEWIVVENHHSAIIKKEDFEQVQDIIYKRDIRVRNNNEYDLFSGHIKCNECGNTMTIKKAKNHEYYYCTSYLRNKICTKHSNNKQNIEKIVLTFINNQIQLIINIDKRLDEIIRRKAINYDFEVINARIKEIYENIKKYKLLKETLKHDLDYNYIKEADFEDYNKEYDEILKKLQNESRYMEKELVEINYKTNKNKEWIQKFIENQNIEKLNKKIIDELIEDIYVYENGNIKICFKYQDKYFEALDFINEHKCDIMSTSKTAS